MQTTNFARVSTFFRSNREGCQKVLQMVSLLGNEIRFKILCALKEGDFCVGELADLVEGKHSNVSQQLRMLTLAGFLSRRREEQNIICHLDNETISRAVAFFQEQFTGTPGSKTAKENKQ